MIANGLVVNIEKGVRHLPEKLYHPDYSRTLQYAPTACWWELKPASYIIRGAVCTLYVLYHVVTQPRRSV